MLRLITKKQYIKENCILDKKLQEEVNNLSKLNVLVVDGDNVAYGIENLTNSIEKLNKMIGEF